MSAEIRKRECPCCRSGDLVDGGFGLFGTHFAPEGPLMWMGYQPKGFACLECGFVGWYLVERDLLDLRDRQAEQEPRS